jgi:hypothetical protein
MISSPFTRFSAFGYDDLRSAMKLRYAAILLLAAACLGQEEGGLSPLPQMPDRVAAKPAGRDITLPNGKSQKDEILKSEHAQNIKDAQELAKLSGELRDSLEKNERFVLSLDDLKKTEDIEKLVKKIHNRLRHN